jgi:hypothetical protein
MPNPFEHAFPVRPTPQPEPVSPEAVEPPLSDMRQAITRDAEERARAHARGWREGYFHELGKREAAEARATQAEGQREALERRLAEAEVAYEYVVMDKHGRPASGTSVDLRNLDDIMRDSMARMTDYIAVRDVRKVRSEWRALSPSTEATPSEEK